MTTDDDIPTARPTSQAPSDENPAAASTAAEIPVETQELDGHRPQQAPLLPAEAPEIDLDPDLEQEQDDADIREEGDLLAVRNVPGRERGHGEARGQVPDDGRQPDLAGDPAETRGEQQHETQIEDERRRLHGPSIPAG